MSALLANRARASWIAAVDAAAIRRACGVSQATVANALGISQPVISSWEHGAKRPSGAKGDAYCRVIAGLARHLEVTP